jgi:hypothetical protein
MYHRYKNDELIPVRLHGYERGMSAYFGRRNFYGLLPKEGAICNGVLFPIATKRDYRALLENEGALKAFGRDQVYWATRVTDKTEFLTDFTLPKGWRIMTLVCHSDKSEWGMINPWYVEECHTFASEWGKEFLQEFLNTGGMSMKDWNNYRNQMAKNGRRVK